MSGTRDLGNGGRAAERGQTSRPSQGKKQALPGRSLAIACFLGRQAELGNSLLITINNHRPVPDPVFRVDDVSGPQNPEKLRLVALHVQQECTCGAGDGEISTHLYRYSSSTAVCDFRDLPPALHSFLFFSF
jgi:hypothetical protein